MALTLQIELTQISPILDVKDSYNLTLTMRLLNDLQEEVYSKQFTEPYTKGEKPLYTKERFLKQMQETIIKYNRTMDIQADPMDLMIVISELIKDLDPQANPEPGEVK